MVALNITKCTYVVLFITSDIRVINKNKVHAFLGCAGNQYQKDISDIPRDIKTLFDKYEVLDATEEYLELDIGDEPFSSKLCRMNLLQDNTSASYMADYRGDYKPVMNDFQLQYNPDGSLRTYNFD